MLQCLHFAPLVQSTHTKLLIGVEGVEGGGGVNHHPYMHIRPGLQRFLFDLRQADGSFVMHRDGELDIRLA